MTKKPKLILSIKGKLISAACMLLVAVIMVVSSTYAWFTLSTAPEVKGIQTAIGANGALEMALNVGKTPITSAVVGDMDQQQKNTYWGNLVDLSNGYGLDQIELYPSQLGLNNDGSLNLGFLKVPTYGPDGRVDDVVYKTTVGVYDSETQKFYEDDEALGVRAVGSASGMTPRQYTFRNARKAASTAMSEAKTLAAKSLNTNGSELANIAIKHGLADENTDTYTQEDVAVLQTIVNDLLGTTDKDGSLELIEKAYMQYILAVVASSKSQESVTDEQVNSFELLVTADGATLFGDDSIILTIAGFTLPDEIQPAISELGESIEEVKEAQGAIDALVEKGPDATITWLEISAPLNKLANTSAMKINTFAISDIMNNINELVNDVMEGAGINVTIATDGGVYADIADHCGDYDASIVIEKLEYGNIAANNVKARMQTDSDLTPDNYLVEISELFGEDKTYPAPVAPTGEDATKMPMTEFYGYIIDLAFNTNAANSKLLLQTAATDRIYEGNANEATQGGGSTMTFKATTTDFDDDQVKSLMECIRVVFFTPGTENHTLLATAKLDVANAQVNADGITADLYIYEMVDAFQYKMLNDPDTAVDESTTAVTCYAKTDTSEGGVTTTTYYTDYECETVDTYANTKKDELTFENIEVERMLPQDEAEITDLPQNEQKNVSALVYLDGKDLANGDVSATGTTSVTGKLNLQFSSSANLVPMEYADLHQAASGTSTPATGGSDDAGN